MKEMMKRNMREFQMKIGRMLEGARRSAMKAEPGIDGILVTVGLCIIALLLCVVMKDSLTTFITTLVNSMTTKAQTILAGVII